MRIATWNINGIKARIGLLLTWLEQEKPDIVVLQEIKTVDEGFPRGEIGIEGAMKMSRSSRRLGRTEEAFMRRHDGFPFR